ncbi:MAG TPA: SAVED domain-containing protein [Streptosporangiaceae bacterium]
MVTGIDLAVDQRGQLWSSAVDYDAPAHPAVTEHPLGRGPDLAVAIAVAADPTDDVREFLEAHTLPIDRLLVLRPAAGAKDNAVPTAAAANALAVGIRDTVRRASKGSPVIHLFLAGPMGLAMLLGHRWNRVRPTVVYEDTRGPQAYEAEFRVDA